MLFGNFFNCKIFRTLKPDSAKCSKLIWHLRQLQVAVFDW